MFLEELKNKPVYIVDGSRTPFMKAQGFPGSWSAGDLAVQTGNALLMRQSITPDQIDEVILGCVMSSPDEANIARVVALRLGCGIKTPAWTVQRNCGSGMQALDSAMQSIQNGRSELVLTGGTEAMSRAPLLYNSALVNWLGHWNHEKSWMSRFKMATKFRWSFLRPDIALLKGLTDPTTGFNMGQTAEQIAFEFGITREQMDVYAVESHQRLAKAFEEKRMLDEITPLIDLKSGAVYTEDDGLRRNASLESLAKLNPFFDKKYGKVTAGNSSQITDGACLLLLASEQAIKRYHLPVLGRIQGVAWAGLAPQRMGLGPVYAMSQLLQVQNRTTNDIDYYEINEAFAAQVLACLACWKKEKSQNLGVLEPDKLNQDGGAISLGHPVGASGARIVLHLLHVLKQQSKTMGIASLCIGGGQGGAMLVERL